MTWRCEGCDVNWWPYMAIQGRCPECNGGTVFSQELAGADVLERFTVAFRENRRLASYAAFEEIYVAREIRANGLDKLLVAEPQRSISPRCA